MNDIVCDANAAVPDERASPALKAIVLFSRIEPLPFNAMPLSEGGDQPLPQMLLNCERYSALIESIVVFCEPQPVSIVEAKILSPLIVVFETELRSNAYSRSLTSTVWPAGLSLEESHK